MVFIGSSCRLIAVGSFRAAARIGHAPIMRSLVWEHIVKTP
jgi:hypothetical protein